jgi:hypothetical protein
MKSILIATLLVAVGNAEQLRITVYDKAGLQPGLGSAVLPQISRIFRDAGISVEWVTGALVNPEASLVMYEPAAGVSDPGPACRARRDIALDILPVAPPGLSDRVLGMSHPLARTGLNARVFDNHVRQASFRTNQPHETVLAHAIAHEIGHVLLRSTSHDGHGLMSSSWSGREYEWMTKEALRFTSDQSRQMRLTLSGAVCSPF